MSRLLVSLGFVGALALADAAPVSAQTPVTLAQAVQSGLDRYPTIKAATESAAAAGAGITLARTAYLPRVDLLAQWNRATRNNVFGLLLPQSVVPSISGPVMATHDADSTWGSAVGVLVSWEPIDFGARAAAVSAASAARQQADAAVTRTRLEVSASVADAFLTLLAAQEVTRTSQAAVDRARAVERVAAALAASELRPGLDLDRARAESALASGQFAEATKAVAQARATLSGLIGLPSTELSLQPGALLGTLPDETAVASADGHLNPIVAEREAAMRVSEAKAQAADRSYAPRIALQGAAFARGTGAETSGDIRSGTAGLAPDVGNWAVGLTVTFPVLDFASTRARRAAASHVVQADRAEYDLARLRVTTEIKRARASLVASREILRTTADRLGYARSTNDQVMARYRAGLSTMVEVADAQRLLAQAEGDDAVARLGVWRADLSWCFANGDLEPFLQAVGR